MVKLKLEIPVKKEKQESRRAVARSKRGVHAHSSQRFSLTFARAMTKPNREWNLVLIAPCSKVLYILVIEELPV